MSTRNYPRPRWYTVILLRPDYMTNNYGQDTWVEAVKARDPEEAVKLARGQCHRIDNEGLLVVSEGLDEGDADFYGSPDDYFVIAVIRGKHDDLTPGE